MGLIIKQMLEQCNGEEHDLGSVGYYVGSSGYHPEYGSAMVCWRNKDIDQ